MTRARKVAGRVTFVGTGPGDPGLLTVHGVDALQRAEIVYADSAVSDRIRALAQAEIRDLEATPADTAKAMLTEARAGASVVRLVAGDVFIDDHAVREALAVARTVVPFDIVPGLSIAAGTAAYAGVPVGSVHTEADLRQMEAADFDLLARSPGTLAADRAG